MTDNNSKDTGALPFEGRASHLRSDGNVGISSVQLLLIIVGVFLVAAWGVGLALYSPTGTSAPEAESETLQAAVKSQQTNQSAANQPARPKSNTNTASSDATAEQIAWRDEALKVLETLTAKTEALETQAVLQWAPDEYGQAKSVIQQGGEAYGEQRFRDARDQFKEGLKQVDILEEKLPEVFKEYIGKAKNLLSEKNYDAALEMLEIADSIDPIDAEVSRLINSAKVGAEVDKLHLKAGFYTETYEIELLGSTVLKAIELDPHRQDSLDLLKRSEKFLDEVSYDVHMQLGHDSLKQEDYALAIESFEEAQKIDPSREEAPKAIESTQFLEKQSKLSALKQKAERAMRQENWETAKTSFSAALAIEPSAEFALQGSVKAEYFGSKASQLKEILDAPQRLSDDTVFDHARDLLGELNSRGSLPVKMTKAKTHLASHIKAYEKQVSVIINSDNRSTILLTGGGRINPFRKKEMLFRPGKRTFVARRSGYRDKRYTIEIPLNVSNYTLEVPLVANEKL